MRTPSPFHVSCSEASPLLYELPYDRFQLMTEGAVAPWVGGYQFLLVDLGKRSKPLGNIAVIISDRRSLYEI